METASTSNSRLRGEQRIGRIPLRNIWFLMLYASDFVRFAESLKTAHLYQIYAYLRSQEQPDDMASAWNSATGILLHPAIDKCFDETVTIQGHKVKFITVDLSERPQAIRHALRQIVSDPALS